MVFAGIEHPTSRLWGERANPYRSLSQWDKAIGPREGGEGRWEESQPVTLPVKPPESKIYAHIPHNHPRRVSSQSDLDSRRSGRGPTGHCYLNITHGEDKDDPKISCLRHKPDTDHC